MRKEYIEIKIEKKKIGLILLYVAFGFLVLSLTGMFTFNDRGLYSALSTAHFDKYISFGRLKEIGGHFLYLPYDIVFTVVLAAFSVCNYKMFKKVFEVKRYNLVARLTPLAIGVLLFVNKFLDYFSGDFSLLFDEYFADRIYAYSMCSVSMLAAGIIAFAAVVVFDKVSEKNAC